MNALQIPLIFDDRNPFELAAWHDYGKRHNMPEMCHKIKSSVKLLPHDQQRLLLGVKFYRP